MRVLAKMVLSLFTTGFLFISTLPVQAQSLSWPAERLKFFPELHTLPAWSPDLARLAQVHAEDLARRGVLSHFDAFGRNVAQRAGVLGLPEGEYGEVVGAGPNRRAVWLAWDKSLAHRELLLEPGWQLWGAAEVRVGQLVICVIDEYEPH